MCGYLTETCIDIEEGVETLTTSLANLAPQVPTREPRLTRAGRARGRWTTPVKLRVSLV